MSDPITLLLMDDDTVCRQSLKRVLWVEGRNAPGFTILEAASGPDAMDVLSRANVDGMLLDLHMPGGKGLDWMSRFLEKCPHLAIVIVTGMGDENMAVEAMKRGVWCVVS